MPSLHHTPALILGAGIIGLACARALAARGIPALIVERHGAFGSETSSRNSEVLHAGLYYPTGSRKAVWCVAGQRALYDYAAARGIGHWRCGKLVVASGAQVAKLASLQQQAEANGVLENGPLHWLDKAQVAALEPALQADAGLLVESTGIIDSHALMLALLADAEAGGATLATHSVCLGAEQTEDGFLVHMGDTAGQPTLMLSCDYLINATGLCAPLLAPRIRCASRIPWPTAAFAKGNYFSLAGKAPFSRLIYPMPEPGGLGVHLTLDLGGQARFGPDVQWLPAETASAAEAGSLDYAVAEDRQAVFAEAIRRYWPGLPAEKLQAAYAGIRPKLIYPNRPAEDFTDFDLCGPSQHGVPGLVHLFGIESPGLTSCLPLAEAAVAELLSK